MTELSDQQKSELLRAKKTNLDEELLLPTTLSIYAFFLSLPGLVLFTTFTCIYL